MSKIPILFPAIAALFFMGCADATNPASPQMDPESALGRAVTVTDSSVVTLIHGIPGAEVNVFVNGNQLLSHFTFGTITRPLRFGEGWYWIVIAGTAGNDTLFADSVALPGNINVSVVAHLTEAGMATLSAYVNDLSPIVPGMGRLVVRHAAATSAIDAKLYRGARLNNFFGSIDSLANPRQAQMDIRPGRYTATISSAGSPTTFFGPAEIQLRPHEAYILYAVGSVSGGSFTLLLQRMDLSHQRPL